MRDGRILNYRVPTSTIVADSSGNMDIHTSHSINGTLKFIELVAGNFSATGSLEIFISGTNQSVWAVTSGTSTSNIGANNIFYPTIVGRDTTNTDLSSSNIYVPIVVQHDLRIVGSGLGASKSGLGLNIYYN